LLSTAIASHAANAQARGASVTGRVRDAATDLAAAGALVIVEGANLTAIADSGGIYRLAGVPPGPQVLFVRRVGYAPARVAITVPPTGTIVRDIELAVSPLQLQDVTVTADPTGRARGELGTASVIDRDAIAVQSATSLAGILELVPGVPLAPPGLDGVQQISLRSVPTSGGGFTQAGPSAGDLASCNRSPQSLLMFRTRSLPGFVGDHGFGPFLRHLKIGLAPVLSLACQQFGEFGHRYPFPI